MYIYLDVDRVGYLAFENRRYIAFKWVLPGAFESGYNRSRIDGKKSPSNGSPNEFLTAAAALRRGGGGVIDRSRR